VRTGGFRAAVVVCLLGLFGFFVSGGCTTTSPVLPVTPILVIASEPTPTAPAWPSRPATRSPSPVTSYPTRSAQATAVTPSQTSRPTAVPDSPSPTTPPTSTFTPSPTPISRSVEVTWTAIAETPTGAAPEAAPTSEGFTPEPPDGRTFATLESFWAGRAEWHLEHYDVGLPAGESDTIHHGGSVFRSYLHASFDSAGIVDSCGAPAPFPGCVTLWTSFDGGRSFSLSYPTCLFRCAACPCDPGRDHTAQQQYPRVFLDDGVAHMVYEWGAASHYRTSGDGVDWSAEARVPGTGQWKADACPVAADIGDHPNIYAETEYGNCLVGAPPGIYVDGDQLYIFVGLGRNPGHMGCFSGPKAAGAAGLRPCISNPLFGAEHGYGPLEARGAEANPSFESRTISSADVVRFGDRFYMAYEGVRGPSDPTSVDDQFALGFARSVGPVIDGPWERYPSNPVIMDVANNWGIGHADLVLVGPATYLYTATSQTTRGRYVLLHR